MVFALALAAPATAEPQQAAAPAQPAYLGVELRNLTREDAQAPGLPAHGGAAIAQIEAGSPASAASLRRGDILLEIDGKPVSSAAQALKVIAGKKPGAVVTMRLLRDGKLRAGPVKLGAKRPHRPRLPHCPPRNYRSLRGRNRKRNRRPNLKPLRLKSKNSAVKANMRRPFRWRNATFPSPGGAMAKRLQSLRTPSPGSEICT